MKKLYFIYNYNFIIFKYIIIIFLLSLTIINYEIYNSYSKIKKVPFNYDNDFMIFINNYTCTAGLFALYYLYLGCIHKYLIKGYIPLIDLSSHPNVYNSYNITTFDKNPWELFFEQPFGYSLDNVKKYGKNIEYVICKIDDYSKWPNTRIYSNNVLMNFWNNIAQKYSPIKKKIIKEANDKRRNLFKGSNNVLGVLIRGTDYIARRPKGHPKQPTCEMVFIDIKEMDMKNKYDWIFISTEDELIRDKFIKEFGTQLRFIKSNINIEYDYNAKQYINLNDNIKGNIAFFKIYLINIVILSKCLDIICSRTGGSLGAFILTQGFRNIKVYFLGVYE